MRSNPCCRPWPAPCRPAWASAPWWSTCTARPGTTSRPSSSWAATRRATCCSARPRASADWAPLLDPRFERRGAYHVKDGEYDWSQDRADDVGPRPSASADPDAWSPEDALFVPLRSAAGDVLGILSVDEPADGRRPDDEKLDLSSASPSTPPSRSSTPRRPPPPSGSASAVEPSAAPHRLPRRAAHDRRDARRRLPRHPRRARLREGRRGARGRAAACSSCAPRSA